MNRPRQNLRRPPMITLKVNGEQHNLDIEADMPLLWAIRNEIGLTGTKYGCGIAQCGACTVLMNGKAVRSCSLPVSSAQGKDIVTIEGLAQNGVLTKVQQAWVAEDVPQCGYCQSGQVMSATALLTLTPDPSDADIDAAMAGNICRCGTYVRIRRAIHRAARRVWDEQARSANPPPVCAQRRHRHRRIDDRAECSGLCRRV